MFCMKCGFNMGDSALFCANCGTRIGTVGGNYTPAPIIKSKQQCIYERFCFYMTLNTLIVGVDPEFGLLENYEEGRNGMVYCELVATTRNVLGQTKKTRFCAVIECVEPDGNVVFKGAGPQLMTPMNGTKTMKALLGFKK